MSPSDGPSEKPPPRPWGRLRWGASLAIPALAATLFVSILVLAAAVATVTYRDTVHRTENECRRVVAVAAEHVARIVEETERSLRVVAQWIERNPEAPLDVPDLIALAEAMTLDPGQTRAIAVIDSTGRAVMLEPEGSSRPIDLSAQPYFAAARDGPERTVLFAPPARNLSTGEITVPALYKIALDRRELIVAAAFSVDRVRDLMVSLLSEEDQGSLLLSDGDIVLVAAIENGPSEMAERATADAILGQPVPAPAPSEISCGRAIPGTALSVEAHLDREVMLDGWHRGVAASAGLLLLVLLVVLFLSLELRSFYRRLRASEEGLRESLARANEANQAKTMFLANMSHELRTPLNAIIGFSELIERQAFGPLSEKYRAYVGDILQSGRHLLSIVSQLLDMASIEASKDRLERRPMDPRAALLSAVAMVQGTAQAAGIGIHVKEEGLPDRILCNERAFRQIVVNLVSNAVKFSPQGGRVQVVAGAPEPGWILLAVADQGIGLTPADLTKLFTPFWRSENVWTRRSDGIGLGLALTRRLIEGLGGNIAVESEPGKGSRFTVRLPVNPPTADKGAPA